MEAEDPVALTATTQRGGRLGRHSSFGKRLFRVIPIRRTAEVGGIRTPAFIAKAAGKRQYLCIRSIQLDEFVEL